MVCDKEERAEEEEEEREEREGCRIKSKNPTQRCGELGMHLENLMLYSPLDVFSWISWHMSFCVPVLVSHFPR